MTIQTSLDSKIRYSIGLFFAKFATQALPGSENLYPEYLSRNPESIHLSIHSINLSNLFYQSIQNLSRSVFYYTVPFG